MTFEQRNAALANTINGRIAHEFGPTPAQPNTAMCPRCYGTGSIVSRYANVGGAFFPDEDMCMTCSGSGRVRITPARAS